MLTHSLTKLASRKWCASVCVCVRDRGRVWAHIRGHISSVTAQSFKNTHCLCDSLAPIGTLRHCFFCISACLCSADPDYSPILMRHRLLARRVCSKKKKKKSCWQYETNPFWQFDLQCKLNFFIKPWSMEVCPSLFFFLMVSYCAHFQCFISHSRPW